MFLLFASFSIKFISYSVCKDNIDQAMRNSTYNICVNAYLKCPLQMRFWYSSLLQAGKVQQRLSLDMTFISSFHRSHIPGMDEDEDSELWPC